jgi:protein SCO1
MNSLSAKLTGLHDLAPSAWSAAFLSLGAVAGRSWHLPWESAALILCAAASTATVLLAIRRHWNNDRRGFELVWLAMLLPAAWLARHAGGIPLRVALPFLCALLPTYAAWRFAPDRGQRGWRWALRAGSTRALAAGTLAIVVVMFPGCARHPSAPAAKSFDLHGQVVDVVPQRHTLVVHHESIPGYMPSMTMEFGIGDADLGLFKAGQYIDARLIDDNSGDLRLEGIHIRDRANDSLVDASSRALAEDTHIRGDRAYREVGEAVPSFSLYDQTGNVVSIDRFRGKWVILNFIYTRCPIATMCPAATARMAELQRIARERHIGDLELVSVSLDPEHDTPAVLRAYASARGIDPSNFHFLTGPDSAVRCLLAQFGVIVEPAENYLKHTLSTVLIDRNGKIVYRADGSTWHPEDFLKRL